MRTMITNSVSDYSVSIYLLNFPSNKFQQFLILNEMSQALLTDILIKLLTTQFGFTYGKQLPTLNELRLFLTSAFQKINDPLYHDVLRAFFHHFYILGDSDESYPPILLKFSNQIYLQSNFHSNLPIEILSTLTEQDIPYLFELLRKHIYIKFLWI
jgi:hypothetical protein